MFCRRRSQLICVLLAVVAIFLLTMALEPKRLFSGTTSRSTNLPTPASHTHVGKLFCWILTSNRNHGTRVLAVNETWPKRCDEYSFYTDEAMDKTLGIPHDTVFANMKDGLDLLWPKTKVALKHTFTNYHTGFDWFLKADDDTYVFVENLWKLLGRFDASKPHYLGFRMKPYATHGYNSGGAGYVLSRPALQLFVEQLLPNATLCPHGPSEDLQLALCLASLQILPADTRDSLGRHTFFPYRPEQHFHGKIPNDGDPKFWYYYDMKMGFEAFSDNLITFHHLGPDEIRFIDLLVYRLQRPLTE